MFADPLTTKMVGLLDVTGKEPECLLLYAYQWDDPSSSQENHNIHAISNLLPVGSRSSRTSCRWIAIIRYKPLKE
ncbi:hypothetical protein AB6A40_010746 [Gnathostoma spinigerum]|uniref:Uncharacterized protein n=1 Tax=Gnathostoma spinigerum TaxID=75299 RepID=A0ABD6F3A7_9BILA